MVRMIFTFVLGLSFQSSLAQFSTVDVVQVKAAYEKEAVFFYENNWKVFREEAIREKYVSRFELIKCKSDTTGISTLILITDYADSLSFANREKHFEAIIKKHSASGPKLLNSVSRKEFLISVTGFQGRVLAMGSGKK